LIQAFPAALSHTNDQGQLPIHSAAWNNHSMPFVTLLVEEGVKLNVGGEGNRGGLLVEDPYSNHNPKHNVLQLLVNAKSDEDPATCDLTYLQVLKELRESNLLRKEDIKEYSMLYSSCFSGAKERFKYLVDCDPQALKESVYNGKPLIHAVIDSIFRGIDEFAMMVKAGHEHFPEDTDLGFLFKKDENGKTACESAFANYGKEETTKIILECIPEESNPHPIFRHIVKAFVVGELGANTGGTKRTRNST